jgi:hypothetical protein
VIPRAAFVFTPDWCASSPPALSPSPLGVSGLFAVCARSSAPFVWIHTLLELGAQHTFLSNAQVPSRLSSSSSRSPPVRCFDLPWLNLSWRAMLQAKKEALENSIRQRLVAVRERELHYYFDNARIMGRRRDYLCSPIGALVFWHPLPLPTGAQLRLGRHLRVGAALH